MRITSKAGAAGEAIDAERQRWLDQLGTATKTDLRANGTGGIYFRVKISGGLGVKPEWKRGAAEDVERRAERGSARQIAGADLLLPRQPQSMGRIIFTTDFTDKHG